MNTCTLKQTGDIPATRIKTLVVDDSPFMLKILAQTVEAAGRFDLIGSATEGHQALRYVSMLTPDLVVMDLHMPGLNGVQLTRCIKGREHPPVVIIVSSDDSSKTTAELAGADAFVSKGGNLRHRMIGTLHKIFGPGSATQTATAETRIPRRSKQ